MRHKANNDAHMLLQYLISKAVFEGRTGSATINIPLLDFVDPYDGVEFTNDALDLVLKVKITTSYDSVDAVQELIESDMDDDLDLDELTGDSDGTEKGHRPNTGKNKKSN